jgi:hypothetical protein
LPLISIAPPCLKKAEFIESVIIGNFPIHKQVVRQRLLTQKFNLVTNGQAYGQQKHGGSTFVGAEISNGIGYYHAKQSDAQQILNSASARFCCPYACPSSGSNAFLG